MEANKSKYSCVSASCGKPLFSEVKFCPYCAEPYISEESKLKALQEAKAKEKQELAKQEALAKENARALAAAKALAEQAEKQAAEALAKADAKAKKDQELADAAAKNDAIDKAKQAAQEAQKAEQEKAKQQEQATQTNTNTSTSTSTSTKAGQDATTTIKPPRTYEVKPEDKKGGFGKWLLILIVVGVAGFYGAKQWAALGSGSNICEQTITDVTGMLATGDANGALIKIKEVLPECSGEPKTRLLDMQKAANKALKAQTAACNAALAKVNQALNKNQIVTARKAFDKLPANCESFNQAKNLKDALTQKEDLIKTAETDFDAALLAGSIDKAKIALNKLQEITREYVNLAKMKTQLDDAMRKSETTTPAPVQNTVPVNNQGNANNNRQNQVAPTVVNSQNLPQITNNVRDWVDANRKAATNQAQAQAPAPVKLPNNTADIEQAANNRMVQTFMQEAQNALQNKRFDVARTQVQNALRVDPGNMQAQLLLRRINEVQMQTLRSQTTID